jgi:hypothetical protein
MLKEALNTLIDNLEKKMIENGMSEDEVKKDKENLLKAINIVIDEEKRNTFHSLASEIQKVISPENMQ